MSSAVHSVNISDGGVPKLPVAEAMITELGGRISQALFPGWSRVYAKVHRDGLVRVRDRVEISGPSDMLLEGA